MQEFDLIETPENVELERPLAGIGSRFIAGFVDNMLVLLICLVLLFVLWLFASVGPVAYLSGLGQVNWWGLALVTLALYAVYWGYFVFFEMVTNGQSPGKKRLKIRVVKEGGGAVTFTDVAIRNLLRAVDMIPLYGVAGICMFLTRKAQRLGDLAAGTVVISEQTREYSARSDKRADIQWEREVSPVALRSTGLSPKEYRALTNYWVRRDELTLEARRRVLPQLLQPILQHTGEALPDGSLETLESYVDSLLQKAVVAEREAGQRTDDTESKP